MRVYKVEIRGKGVEPYSFQTKEDAVAWAITATAWSGGQYRIFQAWERSTEGAK